MNADDDTVLTAGMVITLEPSTSFTYEDQARIMVQEENVVVTGDGYELLTTRTPSEMPLIK